MMDRRHLWVSIRWPVSHHQAACTHVVGLAALDQCIGLDVDFTPKLATNAHGGITVGSSTETIVQDQNSTVDRLRRNQLTWAQRV